MLLNLKLMSKITIVIMLNLAALASLAFLTWRVNQTSQAIKQKTQQLANLEGQRLRFSTLKTQMAASGPEREAINRYFVDSNSLPVFIERLEELAATNQITLNLTSAAVSAGQATPTTLEFKLTATAAFSRLFNFIALMENLPYRLRFNQLRLTPLQTASSTVWQATGALELLSFTP